MAAVAQRTYRLLSGLVLLGALVTAVLAVPEPAEAKPKVRCPGAGGTTLIRTAQVRIFTRRNPEVPSNPDFYGCLYRKRTAFRLNVIDDYGVLIDRQQLLLSGRYVGLIQRLGSGAGSDTDLVVVRDLLTGRGVYGPYYASEGEKATDLVLKPNGVAAFIYEGYINRTPPLPKNPGFPPGGVGTNQVHVLTRTGSVRTDTRLVDQGLDIDPYSLELSPDGRSVTYLKAGERRSVPVP